MFLNLFPTGPDLTRTQARELDDAFFLANPLAQFSSKISLLLDAHDALSMTGVAENPDFNRILGFRPSPPALAFGRDDREHQLTLDAISVRHQAAEALARFAYAIAAEKPDKHQSTSIWQTIAMSPNSIQEVLLANKAALESIPNIFAEYYFPPDWVMTEERIAGGNNAVAWLNHASQIMSSENLSTQAANNKIKHGMAVSVRNDLRVEILLNAPRADGTIPLSNLGPGKSLPLFDRPALTYLNRPSGTPKRGWEAVSLRVDIPTVLAETWMIAHVYASMFHVAAIKHFGQKIPDSLAPYPPLVLNRRPEHVVGARPIGYRSPLTNPPDGSFLPRPGGLIFMNSFIGLTVNPGSKTEGKIVDD